MSAAQRPPVSSAPATCRLLGPSLGLCLALGCAAGPLSAALPAASSRPAAKPAAPPRPNVLLVVADDLTTRLGAYGDREVQSPSFDRLAARGARFDHAYSSYPICNPSRVTLLSGLTPETTRVFNNLIPPLSYLPNLRFLPAMLAERGYQTFRSGKVLHSTFDDAAPFAEVADLNDLHFDAPYPKLRKPQPLPELAAARERQRRAGQPVANTPLAVDRLFGQPVSDRESVWLEDSRVAERTIEFLRRVAATPGGKPFFAAVGLLSSHPPWPMPARWASRYEPARISLAVAPADDRADVPSIAFKFATVRPSLPEARQREVRAAYAAGASFLDEQLGRILTALAETKLDRNTLVVVTSDHGQHLGEHAGLWEKMTLFEETARVPWVIAGPGVAKGQAVPCVVEQADLVPTVLDLAGLPPEPGLDGRSLKPFLANPKRCDERGALTWIWLGGEPTHLARSLRTDRYRYTEWEPGAVELYDHLADPGEHHNLAADPASEALREGLHRRLGARTAAVQVSAARHRGAATAGATSARPGSRLP